MRKSRRTITIILSFLMTLQLCSVGAFAAETNSRTFSEERLSDEILEDSCFYKLPDMYSNIVEVSRTELSGSQLTECVSAQTEDGIPIDCGATLCKIVYRDSGAVREAVDYNKRVELSTIYVLRGTTKTSSGSTNSHGVTLTADIRWIDNSGANNQFLSAGGTRSGACQGSGYYSVNRGTTGLDGGTYPSSFTSYGSSNQNNNIGYSFQVHTHTRATNGKNVQLMVKTSVFD